MPGIGQGLVAKQELGVRLTPKQLQGLHLLAKSLPELRAEIAAEMAANPAIEDVDHPIETPMSAIERKDAADDREPDYPEDDFVPGRNVDEDTLERRQRFLDSQVGVETLQQHLLAQLPTSDIPVDDWPLVEVLVGDLNDNGFYVGSLPDVMMAFDRSEAEVRATLAQIRDFDPPGCGATSAKECLLAQMDRLADSPHCAAVRAIVERHLDDLARGDAAAVMSAEGLSSDEFAAALKELRTLNPQPGRAFPGEKDRVEYVNPEVHVRCVDGWWTAFTDRRSLPEIRLSQKFQAMLADPNQTPETKKYVRERIEAAQAFREAIANRQKTVANIAQAICDHQQDFFEQGFRALKPLTELEIAEEVGVAGPTVSRTVRDKYAETPFGTIELRRFFATGVKTADGELVAQQAVLDKLREIVDAEDKTHPLSDEKIGERLKAAGYPVARRTVAKYRDKLGIPGTVQRRAR